MEKKITIYTVKTVTAEGVETTVKSFTTKKLAQDAKNTLTHFGIEVEMSKESKTIKLD